jgi:hypothetical protein
MKTQTATSPQHTATHEGAALQPTTFYVTAHGPTVARAFDLLYGYTDAAIVDVPDAGAFLKAETALALADLIAGDEQLATLIRQRETLGAE